MEMVNGKTTRGKENGVGGEMKGSRTWLMRVREGGSEAENK